MSVRNSALQIHAKQRNASHFHPIQQPRHQIDATSRIHIKETTTNRSGCQFLHGFKSIISHFSFFLEV